MKEHTKAFPYKPPTIVIKQKYSYLFANQFSLQDRYLKLAFDKLVASLFLAITLPIIVFLKLAFIIEGLITVSYTHLRAHETDSYLVCRLLLEKTDIQVHQV